MLKFFNFQQVAANKEVLYRNFAKHAVESSVRFVCIIVCTVRFFFNGISGPMVLNYQNISLQSLNPSRWKIKNHTVQYINAVLYVCGCFLCPYDFYLTHTSLHHTTILPFPQVYHIGNIRYYHAIQ